MEAVFENEGIDIISGILFLLKAPDAGKSQFQGGAVESFEWTTPQQADGVSKQSHLLLMNLFIVFGLTLVFDVFPDDRFISVFSDGTGEVSIGPELSSPEFYSNLRTAFVDFPGSDAFDDLYDFLNAVHGDRLDKEMDMIFVCSYFQEMDFISLADFQTNLF